MSQTHIHTIQCIGCSASVPDINGPTFRYPDAASPGCWDLFGDVLAREYGEWDYPPIHRLTVDAYAAQHPGRETPQTTQSIAVHLISMLLVLEKGYDFKHATYMLQHAITLFKGQFVWLEPPNSIGDITIKDVHGAKNLEEHNILVGNWAKSVWNAWEAHHDKVREWAYALNY